MKCFGLKTVIMIQYFSGLVSHVLPWYQPCACQHSLKTALFSQLKGSVKEPNMFHNHETEKITRKASDAAEYIELFGSFTRDRHARRI